MAGWRVISLFAFGGRSSFGAAEHIQFCTMNLDEFVVTLLALLVANPAVPLFIPSELAVELEKACYCARLR